jgi:predicted phosphate transport protein (TIGR00153 family)
MRIPLARLLVKNPLPRVGELMDRVVECAEELPELVDRLIAGDQGGVVAQAKIISQLEGQADAAKNEVRDAMPVRLFLPVDRRDFLKLLSQIDAIADATEDVGVLVTMRPMTVPEEMKTLLRLFVDRTLDCVRSAADLVSTLDELLAAGFGGAPAERARTIIEEIRRREHDADKLQDQLAKMLFQQEERISPVALMMWIKILERVGEMANRAENVSDQFRLFLAT